MKIKCQDLHDAQIKSLDYFWKRKKVSMVLSIFNKQKNLIEEVELNLCSVTKFSASLEEPWGPSWCVNSVKVVEIKTGMQKIEIETQSGDRILISGITNNHTLI